MLENVSKVGFAKEDFNDVTQTLELNPRSR
jgi:hypothetical protein